MSDRFHEQASAEFLRAAAMGESDRRAFLAALHASDPALGREVESLLEHDGTPDPILQTGEPLRVMGGRLPPPVQVGPYHILNEIGRGGMGVVYRAERREPVRIEIALKLIKPGLETDRVLARFETERRVLALMDHPGIARVYDAGMSGGRPYVAMEYLCGEPVTRFCDGRRLTVPERLRLFLGVCEAVHHAHQNAVIHRDLKPSNVLVTLHDGKPVPKVIDFGIAKALAADREPGSTLTVAGEFVGTPAYISPEQAMAGPRNIDVRADVYSLGAMLYELLVGVPPFDPERLPEGDLAEIRRVLLHEEASVPSRRLAGLGAGAEAGGETRAEAAARRRGTHVASLARALRGDLDAIVMKAIAKEPDRRYGSALDLAADIRRHLAHEPIEARPPAILYRLRKTARRHPTAAAVTAVTVPLVLAFTIVTATQARRLAFERDQAQGISETIVGLYSAPYFQSGRQGPRDPIEIFAGAARRIETEMAGRPVLQARVQHAIGEAMRATGNAEAAIPLLEEGARRLSARAGEEDPATLAARASLAQALTDAYRFEEAETIFRSVLDARRRSLGDAAADTLRTARDLGFLFKTTGRNDAALPLLSEAADGLRRALGETSEEALVATSLAASVLLDLGRLDEAERLLDWCIPRMDPNLVEKGMAVYNLACVHAQRGERDEAIRLLREAQSLNFNSGYFGDPLLQPLFADPEFVTLAETARALGRGYGPTLVEWATEAIGAGREDEAEAIYRHLLRVLPPRRAVDIHGVQARFRELLVRQGRYVEALPLVEEEVDGMRRQGPAGRGSLVFRLETLARVRLAVGDRTGALAAVDEAIGLCSGFRDTSNPMYLRAIRAAISGDLDAAARLFTDAVDRGFTDDSLLRDGVALRRLEGRLDFERARERLLARRGPFTSSFTTWWGERPQHPRTHRLGPPQPGTSAPAARISATKGSFPNQQN
jgi:serine/threonine protein kinase/tetratricopeptide (TPR) repeat protein